MTDLAHVLHRAPADTPALPIDPFSDAFLGDPYASHAVIRDAGPVVWIPEYGFYAMARYNEVVAALKDTDVFCSSRGVGLSDFAQEEPWRPPSLLLETDPPLHDRTRGIMNKVASLVSLKAHQSAWAEKANALAEHLVARRKFDAVIDLAEVYPLSVFPDLIGVPIDGREHLLAYAATNFNAFGPRNKLFEDTFAAAREAIAWVGMACQRESLAPGSWGAAVYAAADAGHCTEAEAERLVRSFLSAGVDTTVNGIGNLMLALVTHPDQWAVLRAEPAMAPSAFEEALRWDSTAQVFFRTTTRRVTVGSTTIPAGAKVLLMLGAANRDPRKWGEDAHAFRIDRPTSGHVAFGFGIHQCLGQMVARMEARMVLDALVPQIAEMRLSGAPVRRLNNTLHALASLPIEVEPS